MALKELVVLRGTIMYATLSKGKEIQYGRTLLKKTMLIQPPTSVWTLMSSQKVTEHLMQPSPTTSGSDQ